MEDISVKMRHAALNKLCTLDGGFAGADGRRRAAIPVNYWPSKMGCRDWTPGNPVGDVFVIKLPCDIPSQESQASIPYLWIFEGAQK